MCAQLRIELAGIRPPIWRRVLVPASFTLEQLHSVIQMVFEWHDAHMHDFRVRGPGAACGGSRRRWVQRHM